MNSCPLVFLWFPAKIGKERNDWWISVLNVILDKTGKEAGPWSHKKRVICGALHIPPGTVLTAFYNCLKNNFLHYLGMDTIDSVWIKTAKKCHGLVDIQWPRVATVFGEVYTCGITEYG